MNNHALKKIAAITLAAGLLLSCGGCRDSGLIEPGVPIESDPTGLIGQDVSDVTAPTEQKSPAEPLTVEAPVSPHLLQLPNLTAAPEYPEMPQCPRQEDYPEGSSQFYEDQWQWERNRQLYITASPENAQDLNPFIQKAMEQFLSGEDNQVCAPVNIYFALAMLAQTTGGRSRQQILDVLGHSSMDSLRQQANQLWNAHYCSDGRTVSLMANSVWLDEQFSFVQDTLNTLADDHYASVFTGDLGTEEMNRQLAAWLNSQTGGLLSDYTEEIKLDPATVFCLASTAYFSADWSREFYEGATSPEVFHGEDRDMTVDFMHITFMEKFYYEGKGFSAIQLGLSGDHRMWLILPDEGSSPKKLLSKGDYYDLFSNPDSMEQSRRVTLNLSLPKFDVSSKQDLIPGLKAMGITAACNPLTADYSPITSSSVYLGESQHAARVAVDEEGVIAAAYTILMAPTSVRPEELEEIDFTLDRPFLFAITGRDNLPLFAGVVAEP